VYAFADPVNLTDRSGLDVPRATFPSGIECPQEGGGGPGCPNRYQGLLNAPTIIPAGPLRGPAAPRGPNGPGRGGGGGGGIPGNGPGTNPGDGPGTQPLPGEDPPPGTDDGSAKPKKPIRLPSLDETIEVTAKAPDVNIASGIILGRLPPASLAPNQMYNPGLRMPRVTPPRPFILGLRGIVWVKSL